MKKLLLILFLGVFMISLASAAFFPVKDYNEETKTVTISNFFGLGKDYLTAELTWGDTRVPQGIDTHVGTFNFTPLHDSAIIEDLDLISLKNGQVMTRGKQYKVLTYKQDDNYAWECNDVWSAINNSYHSECGWVEDGKIWVEEWIPLQSWLNKNSFIVGTEYVIGVFVDTEQGDKGDWIPTLSGFNVEEWATFIVTNGAETTDGDYTVVTFTSDGWFNVTGDTLNAWVLIIGAGGTGGTTGYSGGGGAGEALNGTMNISAGNYVVTVGQPVLYDAGDKRGGNSSFNGAVAWGGAQGEDYDEVGLNGGSGSGGSGSNSGGQVGGTALTGTVPAGMTSFNNDGGTGKARSGGGGGGCGSAGSDAVGDNLGGGIGGNGINFTINGTSDWTYCNGGTGSIWEFGDYNANGNGGAGYRGISSTNGSSGVANTGSGGGGEFNLGGSGVVIIRYLTPVTALGITLDAPANNSNFTTDSVDFYWNITDEGEIGVANSTLTVYFSNLTVASTYFNDSGLQGNYTDTQTFSDGSYYWEANTYSTDGTLTTGTRQYFTVDTTAPTITINSPPSTSDFLRYSEPLLLNFTATDTSLSSCWFDYNGTNYSQACSSGVEFSSTFIQENNRFSITVYANDTFGNTHVNTTSWSAKVYMNDSNFNPSVYETDTSSFSSVLISNSSLTDVTLDFNGTNHSLTNSSGNWSVEFDAPTDSIGNKSFKYYYTYGGDIIESHTMYQTIALTYFALCNSTYDIKFLNLSFQDESNSTWLSATLPASEFVYYLGSGTVNKTYTLTNNTANSEYHFCATPNETINVIPDVQYKSGSAYPQRIWNPLVQQYTNTLTDKILYLLNANDGIYVTFQVINSADQLLSGVEVNATRVIDGDDFVVGTGTTSASGTVTFWLNPDFEHTFGFKKSGYDTYVYSEIPTQSSYTVKLSGGDTSATEDCIKGTNIEVYPLVNELTNDTSYDFMFNMTSDYWEIVSFGFTLRLSNGTVIGTPSSTTEGTAATQSYNVNNQTIIYMDYYWDINDEDCGNTTATKYWVIVNDQYSEWSLKTLFSDTNTYMDSGLFGLDSFGRILIAFLIIFIAIGIMSYRYGFTSPLAITSMLFGIIFLLDVVIGIIPAIRGINNLLTYIAAVALFATIIRELSK